MASNRLPNFALVFRVRWFSPLKNTVREAGQQTPPAPLATPRNACSSLEMSANPASALASLHQGPRRRLPPCTTLSRLARA